MTWDELCAKIGHRSIGEHPMIAWVISNTVLEHILEEDSGEDEYWFEEDYDY